MSKNNQDWLPMLAGIVVSMIFGFSFFFTAEALDVMKPMQLVGFRFALAALVLTILQIFGVIKINLKGKRLGALFLLALFEPVIYFICETIGVKMTSASESGMLIAIIPIAVTFLSIIFLNERPSFWQLGSIFLSVSGVIFIIVMKGSSGEANGSILGILILLIAVISSAFFNILSRKLSISFKPMEITYVMMWTAAIVFNLIAIVQQLIWGDFTPYAVVFRDYKVLISVLYLGLISSVAAFFMVNFMLSRLEASRSAVFANLTTVIAIIAGVLFRNEPFYWFHGVGSVLILVGVYGTNYFSSTKRKMVIPELKS